MDPLRTALLSLAGDHAIGSKIAIVFDPADPRRVEHHAGVVTGGAALAAEAMLLFTMLSAGLGVVMALLGFLPIP